MKTWYRIRAARKTAKLLIYDQIGAWGISSKDLLAQLAALGDAALTVRINSPGGDVFDALAIYNALSRHPGKVTAQIDALCASAATLVALAADEVRMADNALFMIHDPWTVSTGNSAKLLKQADVLDTMAEQIVGIYARKTGAAPAELRDWMHAETWYTAEQALAAGFIDAIDAPLRLAALITHPLTAFKNPPLEMLLMTDETPMPAAPDVPETPTTPEPATVAEPPLVGLDPVLVSQLCLSAKEPDLIPQLLKAGIQTEAGVRNALAAAKAVRDICALAKMPQLADGLIASGASPEQAKLVTWDAMVARSEATPIDSAAPDRQTLTRAAFNNLNPQARAVFVRAGGQLTD